MKNDHQSLKYFLEERVSSPAQPKWVRKLMGYDYELTYKKGKDNLVADSLSLTFDDQGSLSAISMPVPNWLHNRVMSMTLHYLKSSNAWTTALLLSHITLGMVLH